MAADQNRTTTLMRSGTAARLAGLSPSTLRIWEHRYGVVAPPKTASGQRAYSMQDIERLRLVKRLTAQGHAIGTVANLDGGALADLLTERRDAPAAAQRVFLVGQAVARKLEGRLRPAPALVFDDLQHAEQDGVRAGTADVLVVRVATLQETMAERVLALRHSLRLPHLIVVYAFGRDALAESLRAAGVTVRREPVSGKELARLVSTVPPTTAPAVRPALPGNRSFSDTELVALTEALSPVDCECSRHLAEIVTLLVSFEQYSAECSARHNDDADLHHHLHGVTQTARTAMEQALSRLVVDKQVVI